MALEYCASVKGLEGGIYLISPLPEALKDVIFAYSNVAISDDGKLEFDYQVLTLVNNGGQRILKDFDAPSDYHASLVKEMVAACIKEAVENAVRKE